MQPQTTAGPGRRCVIWVPPAAAPEVPPEDPPEDPAENAPPRRLLAGLSRRHVPVTVLADAPSIMFDLSLAGPPLALIVVEPERQPHLDELLAAVRTYYPRVAVWQYRAGPAATGGGLRRLAATEAEAGAEAGPMPPDRSADTAMGGDTSRGRAEQDAPAHASASPGDDEDEETVDRRALRWLSEEPREPMLTAEELEMLLGPRSQEEPPRT